MAEILTWETDELVAVARTIADQILQHHVRTPGGEVTWYGPKGYGTPGHPLRVSKIGPFLYNGVTGIALFLAALEHVEGGGKYRETSLRAIAPLRRTLGGLVTEGEGAKELNVPIGGLIGLGSLVYGFLKIGQLLGEPALVAEARDLTALITPDRIAADERVRIQTGCAGAILALLALHRESPAPNRDGQTPLDLAALCAQHVLDKQVAFEEFPRAWPLSPGKPPLAGFSYGAAGISYALIQLHEALPRPQYLAAAEEGLAFIHRLYSPERKGYRDMRTVFQSRYEGPAEGTWKDWWASGGPLIPRGPNGGAESETDRFVDIWCHGSAGIVQGRLGALRVADSPGIRAEIRNVLEAVKSFAQEQEFDKKERADDVCCGNMGRIEVLHYAYQKLGDGSYLEAAHTLARRVWLRARSEGGYVLSAARGSDNFAPTLFQGIAGVGYTLLRLAKPESLPCLLVLE